MTAKHNSKHNTNKVVIASDRKKVEMVVCLECGWQHIIRKQVVQGDEAANMSAGNIQSQP